MSDETISLEQKVRFSESVLWKGQRNYFAKKGVNAWARGEVPYYITSNALIAYCYAQMALRYLQDSLRNGVIDANEPIYMFELGTGSGKFSYLFLSHLREFLKHYKLDHLKFCYVMTDFTENNINFWQQHAQFQPLLQEGILDFAQYCIGEKQAFRLLRQNITLDAGSCKNPVLAVGNYIFDTVPHDAFRVTNGKLEESLVSVKTKSSNVENGEIISLDKLETEFSFQEINLPYYNNEALDSILAHYHQHLPRGNFLAPMGAVASIDTLRALSNDRLLVITGDKGYTSLESMQDLDTPHIAFHGSFSMMVNFDFVGRYIQNLGGDTLLADDYAGMKISLLSLGQKFTDLPETAWAYDQFNHHFSTKEFLVVKNKIIDDAPNLDLEQIMSLLKLSYWDADIFMAISTRLTEIANQAGRSYVKALSAGIKAIYKNYYFLNNNKNVPFELGRIAHLIGELAEGIQYYQKSIDYFGQDSAAYFNMGLCYYYQQNLPDAMQCFRRALEVNPDNKGAKEWLTYLQEQESQESKEQ